MSSFEQENQFSIPKDSAWPEELSSDSEDYPHCSQNNDGANSESGIEFLHEDASCSSVGSESFEESDFSDDDDSTSSQESKDTRNSRNSKKRKFIDEAVEDEIEIRSLRRLLKTLRGVAFEVKSPSIVVTQIAQVEHNNYSDHTFDSSSSDETSAPKVNYSKLPRRAEAAQSLTQQCREHYCTSSFGSESAQAGREGYQHSLVPIHDIAYPDQQNLHQGVTDAKSVTSSDSEDSKNAMDSGSKTVIFPYPALVDSQVRSPCGHGFCGNCSNCVCSISTLVDVVSSTLPKTSATESTVQSKNTSEESLFESITKGIPCMSLEEALGLSSAPR